MGSASPCGEPGPWVCEASRDRERLPRGLEGRGAAGRPGSRKRPLQGPRGGLEAELVAGGTIRTGRRLPEKWRQRGLTVLALKQFPQKTPPQVSGSLRRLPSAKMAARATSEGAGAPPRPRNRRLGRSSGRHPHPRLGLEDAPARRRSGPGHRSSDPDPDRSALGTSGAIFRGQDVYNWASAHHRVTASSLFPTLRVKNVMVKDNLHYWKLIRA